jgi:hypothetical protein
MFSGWIVTKNVRESCHSRPRKLTPAYAPRDGQRKPSPLRGLQPRDRSPRAARAGARFAQEASRASAATAVYQCARPNATSATLNGGVGTCTDLETMNAPALRKRSTLNPASGTWRRSLHRRGQRGRWSYQREFDDVRPALGIRRGRGGYGWRRFGLLPAFHIVPPPAEKQLSTRPRVAVLPMATPGMPGADGRRGSERSPHGLRAPFPPGCNECSSTSMRGLRPTARSDSYHPKPAVCWHRNAVEVRFSDVPSLLWAAPPEAIPHVELSAEVQ